MLGNTQTPATRNLYAYANGDAEGGWDPTGMAAWEGRAKPAINHVPLWFRQSGMIGRIDIALFFRRTILMHHTETEWWDMQGIANRYHFHKWFHMTG